MKSSENGSRRPLSGLKSQADGWIEMDFPQDPPTEADVDKVALGKALGVEVKRTLRGRFDILCEAVSVLHKGF